MLGEPVSDAGQERLMDTRTELAFFVMQTHSGWMVRADGAVYGPYSCSETALAEAVMRRRPPGSSALPAWFCCGQRLDSHTLSDGSMAMICIPRSDAHGTRIGLIKEAKAPSRTKLEQKSKW
jgi:hypothetical protein